MSVNFTSANTVQIVVSSVFFNHIGELGVGLGDLFISTNGWNPQYADTSQDYRGHGEQAWNVAVQLNDRDDTSGTLNAYNLVSSNVVMSYVDAPAAGYARLYHSDQEVRYNGSGQSSIASGNWVVDSSGETLTLNIAFNSDFTPGAIWGFHWTETCANDIIEGAATVPTQVPEPSTVVLLVSALFGGIPLRRKFRPLRTDNSDKSTGLTTGAFFCPVPSPLLCFFAFAFALAFWPLGCSGALVLCG